VKGSRSKVEKRKRSLRMPGGKAQRARLPSFIRKKIQRICRYFVFFALGYLVLWESYSHLSTFYTHGLADRAYGL